MIDGMFISYRLLDRQADRNQRVAKPHEADGQTREIPVVLERQIGHWVQAQPAALSEARIAWRQPLPALVGRYAVLYSMQAANPRPDAVLETIDVIRTSDRAVPAVLGITLGEIIAKR